MRTKRVAIQGIEASFHDVAAQEFFGSDIEIIPCNTFRLSCEKLAGGEADFCVMAIENSITGIIPGNQELIKEFSFNIDGELSLPIELHLLTLNGTRMEEIEQIHSHPVALKQCETFLTKYPGKEILALNDTASCARNVSMNHLEHVGVIAGEACATHYGMTILFRNIESNKENYTRFVVLSSNKSKIIK